MKNYLAKKKKMRSNKSIGIIGGTFNPVHLSHLELAKTSLSDLDFDYIKFIPCNVPPHKSSEELVDITHRINMLKLALENYPKCEIDLSEFERDGMSYTIDTLKYLKKTNPDSILNFIIGMDSLLSLTSWNNWQEFSSYCNLVVFPRNDYQKEDTSREIFDYFKLVSDKKELIHTGSGKLYIHSKLLQNVSSTSIRGILGQKDGKLPSLDPKVSKYITTNCLYRDRI